MFRAFVDEQPAPEPVAASGSRKGVVIGVVAAVVILVAVVVLAMQ